MTASALFDGHDASINIMRRIFMSQGCEVIHLGHNRSVQEVVDAALEEDAQGVAVSSYQGGHVEYFEYLVESLRAAGRRPRRASSAAVAASSCRRRSSRLRDSGVTIFSPEDGQKMGLVGMINSVVADCDIDLWADQQVTAEQVLSGDRFAVARAITGAEGGRLDEATAGRGPRRGRSAASYPVLGITGTGGSGKSSLTDEIVRRFRTDQQDKLRIAVIAVDPTRRKGGGALLGDRIRANSLDGDRVFFRSLATRGAHEVPEHLADVIDVVKAAGHDLVIVETPGIGQGDAGIVPLVDHSLYVMTPEFGAASQLEKIDMLDFADSVAINKFERRGAKDALRDVGRQLVRNRGAFGKQPARHAGLRHQRRDVQRRRRHRALPAPARRARRRRARRSPRARCRTSTYATPPASGRSCPPTACATSPRSPRRSAATTRARPSSPRRRATCSACSTSPTELGRRRRGPASPRSSRPARKAVPHEVADQIERWPAVVESYSGDEQVVVVRDREIHTRLTKESLSGNKIPRVSLPRFTDHGELVRFWRSENLPGYFPFTAGVFPFKRDNEDPARMFAGEGDPARTNRRFKILSEGNDATRLSTAFDSVTLYGRDPDPRPDVYGKVGTSGVSVATLDDMKALYDGFDLVAPTTQRVDDDQRPRARRCWRSSSTPRSTSRSTPSASGRVASRATTSAPSWRRTPSPTSAAPCRPTSSRRTRARTPACSPPSSACG